MPQETTHLIGYISFKNNYPILEYFEDRFIQDTQTMRNRKTGE